MPARLAICLAAALTLPARAAPPMLIAPHIAGLGFCLAARNDAAVVTDDGAWARCAALGQSVSPVLGPFLDAIGPATSPSGRFALGYTLTLPLLGLYARQGGEWRIDPARLAVALAPLAEVKRGAVLYLSANHFGDSNPELLRELAADPRNLMWDRNGPMRAGTYFTVPVYPWTLADTAAPVSRLRAGAVDAVMNAVCRLPPEARARIAGVNILGEVHHLFAGFPQRTGFDSGPELSDYSPAAIAGFRAFLAARFGSIAALNAETGFDFPGFAAIEPPRRDIRHDILHGFADEIDHFAAGILPVQGWAVAEDGAPLTATLWLDGVPHAEAKVQLDRNDVTDANPGFPTPNVGWRFDLDFRAIPFGIHVLDVTLAGPGHAAVSAGRRTIVVGDRAQHTPPPYAGQAHGAPPSSAWPGLHAAVDGPPDWTPVFFNPLARLWQTWREIIVRDAIARVAERVNRSCLGPGRAFSHEIAARLNSSWDAAMFATDLAEQPQDSYLPGTTLYGGAAFGDAVFARIAALGWRGYAVAEMHPVFPLTAASAADMLRRHAEAGARYVQPYFMSMHPPRLILRENELVRRLIRKDNPYAGSGAFFDAIVAVAGEPAGARR